MYKRQIGICERRTTHIEIKVIERHTSNRISLTGPTSGTCPLVIKNVETERVSSTWLKLVVKRTTASESVTKASVVNIKVTFKQCTRSGEAIC